MLPRIEIDLALDQEVEVGQFEAVTSVLVAALLLLMLLVGFPDLSGQVALRISASLTNHSI